MILVQHLTVFQVCEACSKCVPLSSNLGSLLTLFMGYIGDVDTNLTYEPPWYRVIPDAQSDGTPLELDATHNTSLRVPAWIPLFNISPFAFP